MQMTIDFTEDELRAIEIYASHCSLSPELAVKEAIWEKVEDDYELSLALIESAKYDRNEDEGMDSTEFFAKFKD